MAVAKTRPCEMEDMVNQNLKDESFRRNKKEKKKKKNYCMKRKRRELGENNNNNRRENLGEGEVGRKKSWCLGWLLLSVL
jgi:hypothetical protein